MEEDYKFKRILVTSKNRFLYYDEKTCFKFDKNKTTLIKKLLHII